MWKKDTPIQIRVTQDQKYKIEFILNSKWKSTSDFLRDYIQKTIEDDEEKNGIINIK